MTYVFIMQDENNRGVGDVAPYIHPAYFLSLAHIYVKTLFGGTYEKIYRQGKARIYARNALREYDRRACSRYSLRVPGADFRHRRRGPGGLWRNSTAEILFSAVCDDNFADNFLCAFRRVGGGYSLHTVLQEGQREACRACACRLHALPLLYVDSACVHGDGFFYSFLRLPYNTRFLRGYFQIIL